MPAMAAEPSEIVLRILDARRRYAQSTTKTAALDGVSLEVASGEIYALIGRNGAGKSTLAKAAIGALALQSGSVRVLGGDPAKDRAITGAIGVAPQEIALYAHLTVAENLDAFATLAGVRHGRADAVAAAMAATACTPRAGTRIDQLSGGWRRRANLAAAIVHRPRLLVLDEPTEGLDTHSRMALRRLIIDLKAAGTAILLISHDADDVRALADRVGVLEAGRLAAEGSPMALMAQAFGGRQDLVVRLHAPAAAAEKVLLKRGLAASEDGLVWSGLALEAPALASQLDRALRKLGVTPAEISVRQPGLDALIAWACSQAACKGRTGQEAAA
jgi:ABC-2 type transport system ATP-binding protein